LFQRNLHLVTEVSVFKAHLKTRTPWEIKIGDAQPISLGSKALEKINYFVKEMQREDGK
jgi:hypothetical protein